MSGNEKPPKADAKKWKKIKIKQEMEYTFDARKISPLFKCKKSDCLECTIRNDDINKENFNCESHSTKIKQSD